MKHLLLLFSLLAMIAGSGLRAADHAVVFAYHRFGEDRFPGTNIRLEQFRAHLDHLQQGGFHVRPLSQIVDALQSGRALPDRTVALTADDAWRSVMTEAWAMVRARGWTMTLFVATDGVDSGIRGYLDWSEIRALQDQGMEIGAHSAAHGHMAEMSDAEIFSDLERSNARFRAELGRVPDLLAWPYGETRQGMGALAAEAGYRAAFGQHSGALSAAMDRWTLPRFAMNERFGAIDRFRLAASSLPLPVRDLRPAETLLPSGPLPTFRFTLSSGQDPRRVSCFHSSSGGRQNLAIEGRTLSFRPAGTARPGRSRYNCTAPGPEGRWYWHGRQFVTPGGRD